MPRLRSLLVLAIVAIAAALAAGPASAESGKKQKHGHSDRTGSHVQVRFGEPQQAAVRGWYTSQIQSGHCPPGLAKKRNGCQPPGQAKKRWAIGRPLPRDVIYYDLPPPLLIELGAAPAGYRYARVANDVLLLAMGSGLVVDAITDLGHL